SLQAEGIGQTPGGKTRSVAQTDVRIIRGIHLRKWMDHPVIARNCPHVDPGLSADQPIGGDTSVLQRLPADFEQQAPPGVHAGRLARRDAEETRRERIYWLSQKSAPARVHLRRSLGIGVEPGIRVPARGWDVDDHIALAYQKLPEPLRRVRSTRKTAAHA